MEAKKGKKHEKLSIKSCFFPCKTKMGDKQHAIVHTEIRNNELFIRLCHLNILYVTIQSITNDRNNMARSRNSFRQLQRPFTKTLKLQIYETRS